MRQVIQTQKIKTIRQKQVDKINSPLAKYDNNGRLFCVICGTAIRTENVWKVHINTKTHKTNLEETKKLKFHRQSSSNEHLFDNLPTKLVSEKVSSITNKRNKIQNYSGIPQHETSPASNEGDLPQGFFDDPFQDAKARHTEYKDPMDDEWERFKREIKEQAHFSNAIIAEDQDEATNERQIEEIDEQMEKWSKVINLEKRKELISKEKTYKEVKSQEIASSDDSDNYDEFSDWRSKRIF